MRNSFIPKNTVIAKSCDIHSMFLAVVKPTTNIVAGGGKEADLMRPPQLSFRGFYNTDGFSKRIQ